MLRAVSGAVQTILHMYFKLADKLYWNILIGVACGCDEFSPCCRVFNVLALQQEAA